LSEQGSFPLINGQAKQVIAAPLSVRPDRQRNIGCINS